VVQSSGYCWYNLQGILKKEPVHSSEKFCNLLPGYSESRSAEPQYKSHHCEYVNNICAILNVKHNLFLQEVLYYVVCWLVELIISFVLNSVGTWVVSVFKCLWFVSKCIVWLITSRYSVRYSGSKLVSLIALFIGRFVVWLLSHLG
jgi:hypothetical protein